MLGVVTLQLKPSMVVYFFNLIAIVVMIFRERRKPQSILVWSLAFYALPIVAFIFYIFIGRGPTLSKKKKYLGKVLADEKYYQ
ncbi:MAG: PLDc N-terminal domain-containing protein, partial [Clostridia bacterium]|nr:PLDc N-terminal domain-containing protein [Clostridia bacterium]